MSILIKGMEMTKTEEESKLLILTPDGVTWLTQLGLGNQKFDTIEVPPHGRLIDADELFERFNVLQKQKDMYGREVSSCFEDCGSLCTEWWCVEEIVADAPTVIPADKDGET